MRRSILSIIFLGFGCCAMEQKPEITYTPRGVLIFLDDSEKELGAVGSRLLTALYQQAGPIIASGSLLRMIFAQDKTTATFIGKSVPELIEAYKDAVKRRDESLKQAIRMQIVQFNPAKWIIKEINNFLYLLLPIASLKVDTAAVAETGLESHIISPVELQLGLKVNHMKTIASPAEIVIETENKKPPYFMNALYDENKKSSDIFCLRPQYYKHEISVFPLWTIYIDGHGSVMKKIVGLEIDDFKKMLNFFEHSIDTRLLIYRSCYAAGLNNELIYNDAISAIQKTYSFAIITQAITDAPAIELRPYPKVEDGLLKLETFAHFDTFLQDVALGVVDYQVLAQQLFPLVPAETVKAIEKRVWGNVPQIKLPGVKWFSVLASQKDVVRIGRILSMAHDPQKPLDIIKFFNTDPKAILLDTSDIPFELVINTNNLEAIISMTPGMSIHRIKKISSQHTINKILDWFMAIRDLDTEKIFFIEEINALKVVKDVIIYHVKAPLETSDILSGVVEKYITNAFYRDGDIIYVWEPAQVDAQIATFEQEAFYESKLKRARSAHDDDFAQAIEKLKQASATGRGKAIRDDEQLNQRLMALQADFAQLLIIL